MKAGVLLMPIIVSQDGCTIDGNARRSINPILCNDWAEYHNQPWAGVLIGYLPSYGKNDKPRDLGADLWQSCKRRLHADAMAEILRHVRSRTRGNRRPHGASWWRRDVCRTHSGSRAGVWLLRQPRNKKGLRSEGSSREHADVLCDVSVVDIIFDINIRQHFLILLSNVTCACSDFPLTLKSKIFLILISYVL